MKHLALTYVALPLTHVYIHYYDYHYYYHYHYHYHYYYYYYYCCCYCYYHYRDAAGALSTTTNLLTYGLPNLWASQPTARGPPHAAASCSSSI